MDINEYMDYMIEEKHAHVEGIDTMSKEELKEELEQKEYIRQRQAEILDEWSKKLKRKDFRLNRLKKFINNLDKETTKGFRVDI